MERGLGGQAARRGNRVAGLTLAVAFAVVVGAPAAWAGSHAVAHYPSYYPDEISIDAVDPATAAKGLGDGALHAYVGAAPAFAGPVPKHVRPVVSLGALLVLAFDPASATFASTESRCAAAHGIMTALREKETAGFVFHPYPVTPYHPDYLHHVDRVEAAVATVGAAEVASSPKINARGRLAEALADTHTGGGDVRLEEVSIDNLLVNAGIQFDGWLGPPWIKEGWFLAHRLLASALTGEPRQTADDLYRRLTRGEFLDLVEQANLERRLVATLTGDCRRMVVGYAIREEYVNEEDSGGAENVAYDSLTGLNTPVFPRTAKLKDYPWNGRLQLGVRGRPEAAWNPVAGFSDAAGRLIWAALGDPALIPSPVNAGWLPNRVQYDVTRSRGQSGGTKVPGDALHPQPGTGALQPVGTRAVASTKIVYDVLASPYGDGTETGPADLVYPFVVAYRWGAKANPGDPAHEPRLEATFAALQDRLAGLKVVRVESAAKNIAPGLDVVQKTPVLEVYLKDVFGNEDQVAALAPPWSTVPWHLLALMEEAVTRGHAAFSKEESLRRRTAWLDLVRDRALHEKLTALIVEFERDRFRPEALKDLVSAEDAVRRWRALKAFGVQNGHFLVTNGPYRLRSWTADSAVLQAVREATYPKGFGTFDLFANPPRAVIREVTRDLGGIAVQVDADIVVKVARHYEIRREPLTRNTARGTRGVLVASRYLLIGPEGAVVDAGTMRWEKDNRFRVVLPNRLPPGRYAAVVGVFLDGNARTPSTKLLRFDVEGTSGKKP